MNEQPRPVFCPYCGGDYSSLSTDGYENHAIHCRNAGAPVEKHWVVFSKEEFHKVLDKVRQIVERLEGLAEKC